MSSIISALEWVREGPAGAPVAAVRSRRGNKRPRLSPYRPRVTASQLLPIIWGTDISVITLAAVLCRAASGVGWLAMVPAPLAWLLLAGRDLTRGGETVGLRLTLSRLAPDWLMALGVLVTCLAPLSSYRHCIAFALTFSVSGFLLLLTSRRALVALLVRAAPGDLLRDGVMPRRALVLGDAARGTAAVADLRQAIGAPIHVAAMVPADGEPSLTDLVRRERIDIVMIAMPRGAEAALRTALDRLAAAPAELWWLPVAHDAAEPKRLRCRPLTARQEILKKCEDMAGSAFLLLAALPAMIAIAALIRCESGGPILFTQLRRGYGDRLIRVHKFRTMHAECRDDHAAQQTTRDDPRVTRVGRFLRRTSLDELPQLLNVLRGEMSLVGPRPHALHTKAAGMLFDEAVENYAARHRVKPGITGWAQVSGWRGETDTVEKIAGRVACDLQYIENWSLWRDIVILAKTIRRMPADREAY